MTYGYMCDKGRALRSLTSYTLSLPPYLLTDPAPLVRLRARLRFNTTNLNYSAHKRGLSDSPLCSHCNTQETTYHTLLDCPLHHHARYTLINELNARGYQLKLEYIVHPNN